MTDREPTEKEIEAAEADVEGHSISEEDPGAPVVAAFDINFGCGEAS
jgi:hypothetical protein